MINDAFRSVECAVTLLELVVKLACPILQPFHRCAGESWLYLGSLFQSYGLGSEVATRELRLVVIDLIGTRNLLCMQWCWLR